MITIIDYGCGNIKAIQNVFRKRSIEYRVASDLDDLRDVQKLILPGVVSFDYAMQKLQDSGMYDRIDELVMENNIPVLGICAGLQIMTKASDEGSLKGFGWLEATVKKIDISKVGCNLNLPHMGWNNVQQVKPNPLLKGMEQQPVFYFLHSYYISCENKEDVVATSNYGCEFVCVVSKKNIYGVQFHPEKSHHYGITLLENFAKL